MFEILALIVCLMLGQSIIRPVVKEIGGAAKEEREHKWRQADAPERERIVRRSCGWSVIGRVASAGALVAGASLLASPALAIMSVVAGWRMIKPIRQEMRDACFYRSTGTTNEPRQG